jgi:hypothetical protein
MNRTNLTFPAVEYLGKAIELDPTNDESMICELKYIPRWSNMIKP